MSDNEADCEDDDRDDVADAGDADAGDAAGTPAPEKPSAANRLVLQSAKQAGTLGLLGLGAASLLAFAQNFAGPEIELRQKEDLEASLSAVLPPQIRDNDPTSDITSHGDPSVRYHVARAQGRVTGVAFEVESKGYGGPIRMVLGVSPVGELYGVRVISHSETPGLGDKIEEGKSDWIHDFDGKSLGEPALEMWAVDKDGGVFDAFSGATITPRAVVRGVKEGLLSVEAKKHLLFEGEADFDAAAAEETSTAPTTDAVDAVDRVNAGSKERKD